MMPISAVFNRFPRVVRDVASRLGKEVELKLVGEGTELDKGLIERIVDPLTHLVRNSLDHGLEAPAERIACGKEITGTITLRASHQGGNIVIEVSDDGRGLNRERILAKARERGIPIGDQPTDSEVWNLIFEAGFSTADKVTDVSGRGVGMDVVRSNIHSLGGRVEIHSEAGVGTRMTVRLPLTLAILDGMSVSCGGEVFIVPLAFIIESLRPSAESIMTMSGHGSVLKIRGKYLPMVTLHELLGMPAPPVVADEGILIVIDTEEMRMALYVDALLGQHQVVIKSLETNDRKVPGISGATIMGDGRVALILDTGSLGRLAASQRRDRGVTDSPPAPTSINQRPTLEIEHS
jgi:two-component system chemotaxis sensor kinase CheA